MRTEGQTKFLLPKGEFRKRGIYVFFFVQSLGIIIQEVVHRLPSRSTKRLDGRNPLPDKFMDVFPGLAQYGLENLVDPVPDLFPGKAIKRIGRDDLSPPVSLHYRKTFRHPANRNSFPDTIAEKGDPCCK